MYCKQHNIVKINRHFENYRFDYKIIHFYTFFMQVISLMTGKMVHSVATVMERKTNLSKQFSFVDTGI